MSSPLSKAEKFYIEQNRHLTVKVLAKDLGAKVSLVKEYLEELEEKKEPVPDLFVRDKHGSVAMTAGQSKLSDEMVNTGPKISEKHKNCIYEPKSTNLN